MVQKIAVEVLTPSWRPWNPLKPRKAGLRAIFRLEDIGRRELVPDCVTAEPVVKGAVDKAAPEDAVFIYVGVGGRDFWKDPNCVFRTDARTKLKSVPTLMKYGTRKDSRRSSAPRPTWLKCSLKMLREHMYMDAQQRRHIADLENHINDYKTNDL
ncbi:hypothetical protein C7M84_022620 [Penaeus vannamei]|uniref:Thioredoxin domain-containing protein 17 n=1 Tax=Penaeus vannamei TaxID=6689 RepID=A0A423U666_PENVA|nr:hypothetical protein C7M84_022620 [Penaeus vannamei]